MSAKKLEAYYLEYANNYVSVSAFAEAHGWTEQKALNVIKLGRAWNLSNTKGDI